MVRSLIVVFFLVSQFSFSQTDSLAYYYNKGELDKAIIYGENVVKNNTKEDTNYVILLNNLAAICSSAEKFDLSEKYYLETRKLLIKHFGEQDITVAKNHNSIGNMYFANKKYEKAKDSFIKSLEILTKIEKYDNEIYCEYLSDLALTYFNSNELEKAEQSFLIVYKLRKANLKPELINVHTNIINLIASINKQKNKLEEAEKYYKESVDILFLNFGEKNIDYQKALFSLGFFYEDVKKHKKAEEYFLKSYDLQKKYLTENTLKRYVKDVEFLRSYFLATEQYDICESFFLENIDLNKNIFGTNSLKHINSLLETIVLYIKLDNHNAIIKYSTEAFNILNDNKLQKSLEYYEANKNLASSYTFIGEYDKAAKHYSIILNNFDGSKIIDELRYNEVKLWLADIYFKKGDFGNCEKLYLELYNVAQIVNSENNFKLLVGLFDLYLELKNYNKASFYYEKLQSFYSQKYFNENNSEFQDYLYNIVSFKYFFGTNQFEVAEKFALLNIEFIEKDKTLSQKQTHIISTTKRQLGLVYKQLGDFKKWKKIVFENYEMLKSNLNQSYVDEINIYLDLANIYSFEKNYTTSKIYLDKCIDIFENKLGTTNNLFEDVYLHYIGMCIDSNISNEEVIKKLNLRIKEDINNLITYQSSDDLLKSIHIKDRTRNMSLNYIHKNLFVSPETNNLIFENNLLIKNLSLRNQQRIKNSIEKSNDAVLKEKYQQFVTNKRYLTKLEELPLAQRPTDFESLKTETENLEKDITRQSATFADAKKTLSISWKQIQEKLLPNDVVIDLVSYNYYNKKWTDSIMYGAFVIKKDSKFPKYINLFEEKQLAALLERNIVAADTIQANILNKQYSDKAISDLFLKPLEKEFNGCKTIYLSPSGLGHQINFKALPISENQTLGEQFNIKLVGSSTSIVDYKTTAFQENKSLEINLYGGIDYAKSSVTSPTNKTNEVAVRSDFGGGFSYLKGTLAEITNIANQVKTNKYNAILKTERNATEESIKLLDGKKEPFVLHLATHGFFFPNPKQELPKEDLLSESKFKIYKTADDPMMRSGLLFAGANKYWGKPTENLTTDDGILTASEISNLDLSACQLVVMSACETGLGQINGSEGVFGLQRAFKMAGVKNIIMSLWKVPDAQTAELFDIFYTECFNGKSIQEAFQTAQAKMKLKYSPYFWAGFVLLE